MDHGLTVERASRGGSHFLGVSGEEGAVIYGWFDPALHPERDGKMGADLAFHTADESTGYECSFLGGRSCDVYGRPQPEILDLLIDEGEDALLAKLTDLYERTYRRKKD